MIVGHGLRSRTVEGPLVPGGEPDLTEILSRRYWCRACDAILVVVPRGVGRGSRYSLQAIAWALALWSHTRATAASVRARSSTARTVGAASATRWASLGRWVRSALAIFGFVAGETGTMRERAAVIAVYVASKAPLITGPVPFDAFYGGAFCVPG